MEFAFELYNMGPELFAIFSSLFGSSKPPTPPDTSQTIKQTSKENTNAAVRNAFLNNSNQVGPLGSITREQTGTERIGGVDVPTFTDTSSLNPAVQGVVDPLLANAGQFAQSGSSTDFLGTLRDLQLPEQDRARAALETRLANQGIASGSEAFNRAIEAQNQADNDAGLRRILASGQFGAQELQNRQTTPLQNALRLVQGSQPGIQRATQGINPANVAGITQQGFQNQMSNFEIEQAQKNALLGGLGGLAGTILGGPAGGAIGSSLGSTVGGGLFG